MHYKMKKLSGDQAINILRSLLCRLSDIDSEELTTLELDILHLTAENPPHQHRGAEEFILGYKDE